MVLQVQDYTEEWDFLRKEKVWILIVKMNAVKCVVKVFLSIKKLALEMYMMEPSQFLSKSIKMLDH